MDGLNSIPGRVARISFGAGMGAGPTIANGLGLPTIIQTITGPAGPASVMTMPEAVPLTAGALGAGVAGTAGGVILNGIALRAGVGIGSLMRAPFEGCR